MSSSSSLFRKNLDDNQIHSRRKKSNGMDIIKQRRNVERTEYIIVSK